MPQRIKREKDKILIEKKVNFWYEFDAKKPDLIELYQSTKKPIAVLGGAPCLPNDLAQLPKDCLKISCNHHAFKITDCDYMAFLDPLENNHSQDYRDTVKNTKAIKISYSNLDETDYYCINEAKFHTSSETGIFATWLASYITSGDVYVCGIGLRIPEEPMHFYDSGITTGWGGAKTEIKIKRWLELKEGCERPERIKIISERLKKYWYV